MSEFITNRAIGAAFWGWFIAQSMKIVIEFFKIKRIDFSRMIGSGGMPSSHAALVTSLSTAIGMLEGWNSSVFALSIGIAAIVMYDAAGVRLAVGIQAKILNQILQDAQNHRFHAEKLKELIGHTPLQVYAGAGLGVLVAIGYFRILG